jgi:sodium/potassium-transporting ATPase subunit alpha
MDDEKGSDNVKHAGTPVDVPPANDTAVSTPDANDANDKDAVAARAVAFPDAKDDDEKAHVRRVGTGIQIKREMTQEDRELANAGYEHLEEQKAKQQGDSDFGNVDIVEHKLSLKDLEVELQTSFSAKEPGSSQGLSSEQAKERLARDGRNVLTPPKKKSAFRKVCNYNPKLVEFNLYHGADDLLVFGLSSDHV